MKRTITAAALLTLAACCSAPSLALALLVAAAGVARPVKCNIS